MRGISNNQARFLAYLQRELGLPYTGQGLSRAEASILIDVCVDELRRRHGEKRLRTLLGRSEGPRRARAAA